jgi:hypothetical protein
VTNPLNYEEEHYFYPTGNFFSKRALKYKGIPDTGSLIPPNTLLRVSLPKWWKPEDSNVEEHVICNSPVGTNCGLRIP